MRVAFLGITLLMLKIVIFMSQTMVSLVIFMESTKEIRGKLWHRGKAADLGPENHRFNSLPYAVVSLSKTPTPPGCITCSGSTADNT